MSGHNERAARGGNHTSSTGKKRGICATLGEHIFTHGEKGSADKFNNAKEKLAEHIGATCSQDIATEIQTGKVFKIKEPEHDS